MYGGYYKYEFLYDKKKVNTRRSIHHDFWLRGEGRGECATYGLNGALSYVSWGGAVMSVAGSHLTESHHCGGMEGWGRWVSWEVGIR